MNFIEFRLQQKLNFNPGLSHRARIHTLNISNFKKSIKQDFKSGTSIGHKSINLAKKKYWHPLMSDFLLGIRHKIAIFNPYSFQKNILQAFYIIALVLKNNGHVLIINTNQDYSNLTRNFSLLTLQNKSNSKIIDKKFPNISTSNIS